MSKKRQSPRFETDAEPRFEDITHTAPRASLSPPSEGITDLTLDDVEPFKTDAQLALSPAIRRRGSDQEAQVFSDLEDSKAENCVRASTQLESRSSATSSQVAFQEGIASFTGVLDEQLTVLRVHLLYRHERIFAEALGLEVRATASADEDHPLERPNDHFVFREANITMSCEATQEGSTEDASECDEDHAGRGGRLKFGATEVQSAKQRGGRVGRRATGQIDKEQEASIQRINTANLLQRTGNSHHQAAGHGLPVLDDRPPTLARQNSLCSESYRAGLEDTHTNGVPQRGPSGRRKSYLSKVSREFQEGVFEAHEVWYIDTDLMFPTTSGASKKSRFSDNSMDSRMKPKLSIDPWQEAQMVTKSVSCWGSVHWFVVQPNTAKRLFWDVFCIIFNLYDVIVMPLSFFDLNNNSHPFMEVMAWITRVFWTFDIPASFFTGYVTTTGNLEMRLTAIARTYMKSWLPLDLIIVSADWTEYYFDTGTSSAEAARPVRSMRALRTLRMLRLLRLVRMPHVFKRLSARVVTDNTRVIGTVANIMLCILIVAHIFACIWYGIGVESLSDMSWLNTTYPDLTKPAVTVWYKYMSSLLWSLSKISSGDSPLVDPQSLSERGYTVSLSAFAFIFSAAAVSMITSSMTRFDLLTSREAARFHSLRQYMIDHNISAKLLARVQRNAEHALAEKRRHISEHDVELLRLVSEPLRMELHFEVYSPALRWHPFFNKYCIDNPAAMQQICHSAISVVGPYSKGDTLFTSGEVPEYPKMMFITSGQLTYTSSSICEELSVGRWICEHVLWVPWRHCGTLKASSEQCRLQCIDSASFQHLVTHFFSTAKFVDATHPSKYAIEFVKRLNNADIGGLSDISTLQDAECDVLKAFPWNVRFKLEDNRKTRKSMMPGHGRRGSFLNMILHPWKRVSTHSAHSLDRGGLAPTKTRRGTTAIGTEEAAYFKERTGEGDTDSSDATSSERRSFDSCHDWGPDEFGTSHLGDAMPGSVGTSHTPPPSLY